MLKRGYHGTFHKISPEYLNRYVQEFAGRQNVRESDNSNVLLGLPAAQVHDHRARGSVVAQLDREWNDPEQRMIAQFRRELADYQKGNPERPENRQYPRRPVVIRIGIRHHENFVQRAVGLPQMEDRDELPNHYPGRTVAERGVAERLCVAAGFPYPPQASEVEQRVEEHREKPE